MKIFPGLRVMVRLQKHGINSLTNRIYWIDQWYTESGTVLKRNGPTIDQRGQIMVELDTSQNVVFVGSDKLEEIAHVGAKQSGTDEGA